MTVRSSDLVRDVRPERRVVAVYHRDGWKLSIEVWRARPTSPPQLVLRTFGPQERGSQIRVRLEELDGLEGAIRTARRWTS